MTIGDLMKGLVVAFYADFALIAVFFASIGYLLGYFNRPRRSAPAEPPEQVDDGQPWLEPVLDQPVFRKYLPGVARVGDAE